MTTETVEVERTVTEEEELTICDGCGTSDEEHSEMVTFSSTDPRTRGDIHLHRQCIDQMNGVDTREPSGPSIRDKSDWTILFAVDGGDTLITMAGLATFAGAVWVLAHGDVLLAILPAIVSLIAFGWFVLIGGKQAVEAR